MTNNTKSLRKRTKEENWDAPSLAVVVSLSGDGVVLWYGGGPSLDFEIEEVGSYSLVDLGLDDAPDGIHIWEGRYFTRGGRPVPGSWATGTFRPPNDAEWAAIRSGTNPWPRPQGQ